MADEEKKRWAINGVNFARYKEKSKAYKEGRPIPEISDEDAKKLYDELIRTGKVKGEVPLILAMKKGMRKKRKTATMNPSLFFRRGAEPELRTSQGSITSKVIARQQTSEGSCIGEKFSPVKPVAAEKLSLCPP
ncbi:hypothetical protein G7Y79_00090g101210 [Physcia stellaris]|nr:hypothetical protein G7Y79_00090g101210 [Physcia stellaris]